MADADLYNLEFLSLVAKITQEIDNHTGLNEKSLAEFTINLHEKSNKSLDTFKAKLKENDASFPDSLVENIDRLIFSMHPKYKKKSKSRTTLGKRKKVDGGPTELERQKRMFPGLAMQDKEVPSAVADDVFLKELGDLVAGKTPHSGPADEPQRKRPRTRSPSPRRRSHSPRRMDDADHGHNRGRRAASGRRPSPTYDRRTNGARQALDERPVLYKIYNGKVSGTREFGAFVTLDGVAGRVEGKSSSKAQIMFD
jgi:ATP-dependent RNA helicase DHX8/PRP22